MKDRLLNLVESLRASLWLIPMVMVLATLGLAYVTLVFDEIYFNDVPREWWLYTGSSESARTILATVAGSMITVAGLVFSLVMVALTLASQQFGPRLLRNFTSDAGNQFVLGTFISTFLYCLVILRAVRDEDPIGFTPHFSVMVGLVMALGALMVLIYFMHHIASSIQADYLVGEVGKELENVIRRLYPERDAPESLGKTGAVGNGAGFDGPEDKWAEVESVDDGYIQAIDFDRLMRTAVRHDIVIRVEQRAGHYLLQRNTLARVAPAEKVSPALERDINRAFILGGRRTPTQDVEFGVDSLVEIAMRALSPAMNDPFTAISCIDRIGVALTLLTTRGMPSPCLHDKSGRLRILKHAVAFPNVCDAAFNQIRQTAPHMPAIMLRLLEIIAAVGDELHRAEDAEALAHHAGMIRRAALSHAEEESDRLSIEDRYRLVMGILRQTPAPCRPLPEQVDFARDSL